MKHNDTTHSLLKVRAGNNTKKPWNITSRVSCPLCDSRLNVTDIKTNDNTNQWFYCHDCKEEFAK